MLLIFPPHENFCMQALHVANFESSLMKWRTKSLVAFLLHPPWYSPCKKYTNLVELNWTQQGTSTHTNTHLYNIEVSEYINEIQVSSLQYIQHIPHTLFVHPQFFTMSDHHMSKHCPSIVMLDAVSQRWHGFSPLPLQLMGLVKLCGPKHTSPK